MDKWRTVCWWEIIGEDSDLCGEEFFTDLENATIPEHREYAHQIFPKEDLRCLGLVSAFDAEMTGLDIY